MFVAGVVICSRREKGKEKEIKSVVGEEEESSRAGWKDRFAADNHHDHG